MKRPCVCLFRRKTNLGAFFIQRVRKLLCYSLIFADKFYIFKLNGFWLVGFVALRPKSTALVIAGRSVHLTTLFPGQA